jgi:hypothetical protein
MLEKPNMIESSELKPDWRLTLSLLLLLNSCATSTPLPPITRAEKVVSEPTKVTRLSEIPKDVISARHYALLTNCNANFINDSNNCNLQKAIAVSYIVDSIGNPAIVVSPSLNKLVWDETSEINPLKFACMPRTKVIPVNQNDLKTDCIPFGKAEILYPGQTGRKGQSRNVPKAIVGNADYDFVNPRTKKSK